MKIYVKGSNLSPISFTNGIKSLSVDLINGRPNESKELEITHGNSQIGNRVTSKTRIEIDVDDVFVSFKSMRIDRVALDTSICICEIWLVSSKRGHG